MLQTFRSLLCLSFLALSTTPASACAVCFGGSGGSWISGFTWGVAFLVLLPFLMMAGFVGWIALAIRRHTRRNATLTAR